MDVVGAVGREHPLHDVGGGAAEGVEEAAEVLLVVGVVLEQGVAGAPGARLDPARVQDDGPYRVGEGHVQVRDAAQAEGCGADIPRGIEVAHVHEVHDQLRLGRLDPGMQPHDHEAPHLEVERGDDVGQALGHAPHLTLLAGQEAAGHELGPGHLMAAVQVGLREASRELVARRQRRAQQARVRAPAHLVGVLVVQLEQPVVSADTLQHLLLRDRVGRECALHHDHRRGRGGCGGGRGGAGRAAGHGTHQRERLLDVEGPGHSLEEGRGGGGGVGDGLAPVVVCATLPSEHEWMDKYMDG